MDRLTVIIPSYKEPYLNNTLKDLLLKAKGDIQIIVNIDGVMPENLIKDKRILYIHNPIPIGMRGGINNGLRLATGKYIMKTDAHCAFAPGFDKQLKNDFQENWLVIPRRYSLDPNTWWYKAERGFRDYMYISYPQAYKQHKYCMVAANWHSRTKKRFNHSCYEIDDTMAFQGSCWFANKDYFMKKVGYLDGKKYGGFGGEQLEVGLKYWLGGGKVKRNKKTWYAHLFKNSSFYSQDRHLSEIKNKLKKEAKYEWIVYHWTGDREPGMVHPFSWLIRKFWPVPGWPDDSKKWVFTKKVIKGSS